MRQDAIEVIEYKGYKIKIYQDEDALSPRDPRWQDNITLMLCKHRNYGLGDVEASKAMTPEEIQTYVKRPDVIALPLYLYDHSGLRIKVGSFQGLLPQGHAEFDTSMVGWITITHEAIRKEMARPRPRKKGQINPDLEPIKHISKKDRARVVRMLESEVEEYDAYLSGQVVGYVIEDSDGEEIDSCWGFYPEREEGKRAYDYMLTQCEGAIDHEIKERAKVAAEEAAEEARLAHIEENVTAA